MKLGPRRNYHEGRAAIRHYANQPAPYDFCVSDPISCLLTVGSTPVKHSVLNVKAVVAAFNQEKALLRAYESSDGTFSSTTRHQSPGHLP